ncbi:MAG: DUF3899 domain-containing protein [Bacillota bacterium]|nr:DUF3899 domain-containing protein [Bacillota bacterium]
MNKRLKNGILMACASQVLILSIALVFYHRVTLLSYINISFFLSAILLLTSLLIYTIHSGFYDAISASFRVTFSRTHGQEKQKLTEITPLSELVAIDQKPLLVHGLIIGFFMFISLCIYYV